MKRCLLALCLMGVLSAYAQEQVPQQKVKSRHLFGATYNLSKDAVWSALMQTLTSGSFNLKTIDQTSGSVFFEPGASWNGVSGSFNEVVQRYTTKSVKSFSTWKGLASTGSVSLRVVGPAETELVITIEMKGFNGFSGVWEELYSNGQLEKMLLDVIETKLPEPVSAPTFSSETARSLTTSLDLLKKVDAAFRLDASREVIMERLIDALAAVEPSAVEAPAALQVRHSLRLAAENFRKALDLSGAPRDLLLNETRKTLAEIMGLIQDRSAIVK